MVDEAEHSSSAQIEDLNRDQPEIVEREGSADFVEAPPPDHDPPRSKDEIRAEAERHHAALTREGEAPHPVELGHAVVFILGVMKEYVA